MFSIVCSIRDSLPSVEAMESAIQTSTCQHDVFARVPEMEERVKVVAVTIARVAQSLGYGEETFAHYKQWRWPQKISVTSTEVLCWHDIEVVERGVQIPVWLLLNEEEIPCELRFKSPGELYKSTAGGKEILPKFEQFYQWLCSRFGCSLENQSSAIEPKILKDLAIYLRIMQRRDVLAEVIQALFVHHFLGYSDNFALPHAELQGTLPEAYLRMHARGLFHYFHARHKEESRWKHSAVQSGISKLIKERECNGSISSNKAQRNYVSLHMELRDVHLHVLKGVCEDHALFSAERAMIRCFIKNAVAAQDMDALKRGVHFFNSYWPQAHRLAAQKHIVSDITQSKESLGAVQLILEGFAYDDDDALLLLIYLLHAGEDGELIQKYLEHLLEKERGPPVDNHFFSSVASACVHHSRYCCVDLLRQLFKKGWKPSRKITSPGSSMPGRYYRKIYRGDLTLYTLIFNNFMSTLARKGFSASIALLAAQDFSLNVKGSSLSYTPLYHAIKQRNWGTAHTLLALGAAVINPQGETMLHCFVERSTLCRSLPKYNPVHAVLFPGIQLNAKKWREYAMLRAAMEERELLKILLKRGIQLQATNKGGDTALMIAFKKGKVPLVRDLILQGALNGLNQDMLSKHLYAACHRDVFLDEVKKLVELGASLDAKMDNGDTPLHIACARGAQVIAAWILSQKPKLIYAQDATGDMPIQRACYNGQFELVLDLLRANVIKIADEEDDSIFHFACRHGYLELVRTLHQEFAVDINAPAAKSKLTPLQAASLGNKSDVVSYLLENDAHNTSVEDELVKEFNKIEL